MQIDVSNMTTPYQPATFDDDFTHQIVDIKILPNQSFVLWEFDLIPNEAPEKNEAFCVILSSVGYSKFLTDSQDVYNKTLIVINDPQSELNACYAYSQSLHSHDNIIIGLVGFIQNIYTVREDADTISLSIFLFNSSIDDIVEVNFTTFEKTAIEGT
jgi:hypothetical protein